MDPSKLSEFQLELQRLEDSVLEESPLPSFLLALQLELLPSCRDVYFFHPKLVAKMLQSTHWCDSPRNTNQP